MVASPNSLFKLAQSPVLQRSQYERLYPKYLSYPSFPLRRPCIPPSPQQTRPIFLNLGAYKPE